MTAELRIGNAQVGSVLDGKKGQFGLTLASPPDIFDKTAEVSPPSAGYQLLKEGEMKVGLPHSFY